MKNEKQTKRILLMLLWGALAAPLGAQEKKDQPAPYPLKTCIVSDEKLGEMGDPLYLQYKGQVYGFCCKPCTKDFRKDPESYRKKFNQKNDKKSK